MYLQVGDTSLYISVSDSFYVHAGKCFQKCKDCVCNWERYVLSLRDKEYFPEWCKYLDAILPLEKGGEGKDVLDVTIGKKEHELVVRYRSVETESCVRIISVCSESSQLESEFRLW